MILPYLILVETMNAAQPILPPKPAVFVPANDIYTLEDMIFDQEQKPDGEVDQ